MRTLDVGGGVSLIPGYPAVFLKSRNAVVICDLHLGFETAVIREGVYLPRVQLRRAQELMVSLAHVAGARELVICGDLKHVFERLTPQEREEATKLLALAKEYFDNIVLVRGNHDNYVTIVTDRFDVMVVGYLEVSGDTVVIHGHEYDERVLGYKNVIMGHEHPALRIPDEIGGVLKLPAFLLVPLRNGSRAVVLPAAGHYQTGNVLTLDPSQYLSPLIRGHGVVSEAVPLVLEYGKLTLEFPRLANLVSYY